MTVTVSKPVFEVPTSSTPPGNSTTSKSGSGREIFPSATIKRSDTRCHAFGGAAASRVAFPRLPDAAFQLETSKALLVKADFPVGKFVDGKHVSIACTG